MHPFMDLIINLSDCGYKMFPVNLKTKQPLTKHGYKSATSDKERLKKWFNHIDTNIGVGMRLDTSDLVVIDVDNHDNQKGTDELKELASKGKVINTDNCDYIEQTQSNGLHYFFKKPKGLDINKTNIKPHIELQTQQTIISPSNNYKALYGELNNVKQELPNFILGMIRNKNNHPNYNQQMYKGINWTGRLINELFDGTTKGSRNNYMTSLVGKLLHTGANANNVYELMLLANDHLDEPLNEQEINTIFQSILNKELNRQ